MAASPSGTRVVLRLAHGYNMPMCMKMKGYSVEPLKSAGGPGDQMWRLVSETGETSIWVTAMLRAADFEKTDVDIRSMAFPRVATREDPNWIPRGITAEGMAHPVQSMKRVLRLKWNNARCSAAAFLKLRQPVWASPDVLALVAHSFGTSVAPREEADTIRSVIASRDILLEELRRWRSRPSDPAAGSGAVNPPGAEPAASPSAPES
jgi:hypothetical protein